MDWILSRWGEVKIENLRLLINWQLSLIFTDLLLVQISFSCELTNLKVSSKNLPFQTIWWHTPFEIILFSNFITINSFQILPPLTYDFFGLKSVMFRVVLVSLDRELVFPWNNSVMQYHKINPGVVAWLLSEIYQIKTFKKHPHWRKCYRTKVDNIGDKGGMNDDKPD